MGRKNWMLSAGAMALLGGLAAQPALAQTAPEHGGATIEELVVTAQRRSESLQNLPLASSAYSAAQALARTNTQGIEAIAAGSLRVTMTTYNIGQPQVYIRGVGTQSASAASDSSIAVSLDEAPIGRAGATSLGTSETCSASRSCEGRKARSMSASLSRRPE